MQRCETFNDTPLEVRYVPRALQSILSYVIYIYVTMYVYKIKDKLPIPLRVFFELSSVCLYIIVSQNEKLNRKYIFYYERNILETDTTFFYYRELVELFFSN